MESKDYFKFTIIILFVLAFLVLAGYTIWAGIDYHKYDRIWRESLVNGRELTEHELWWIAWHRIKS